MKIRNAVCYSFSLNGEDPLAHLRLIGPLRQSGINIISGIENNQININRVSEGDLIIIQREIPKKFDDYKKIMELARKEEKPVVFDLDDLLFCLPENHPDRRNSEFGSSLLPMFQMLMEADLVSVSTPKLRDFVLNYNSKVVVLPNYFDDNLWKLKPPVLKTSNQKTITIGYMGGNSHKPDLEYVAPVLLDLMERYPQKIQFQFWGVRPPVELADLPLVKWTPAAISTYEDFSVFFQTQTADIFIAPLTDNLFNRCKSPIKFFEYSALGVPGVFSQLDAYAEIVTHGQNGLLASSLDEWEKCLIELIEDEELRFNLANNAQKTIRENWLLSQNAFRWSETFQNSFEANVSKGEGNSRLVNIIESINQQLFETFNKKEADLNKGLAEFRALATQAAEKEQAMQLLVTQVAEKEQAMQLLATQVAEKEQAMQLLATQVTEKEQTIQMLDAQLNEIVNSRLWKIALVFRRIRVLLVPPNSRRARLLRLGMRAIYYLKRFGILLFARLALEKLIQGVAAPVVNPRSDPFTIITQDGTPCSTPAISVVIEINPEFNLPSVKEADVLNWVSGQSLREVEVVVWYSDRGTAAVLGELTHTWDAPDLEGLCRELAGCYLCMASADLLQRNRVYLETNLIALESEDLAFTVNILGNPDWLVDSLTRNHLPGNRMMPYLRQVIRKDCVRNDFSLDITGYLIEQTEMPTVAGKIIAHTTTFSDTDNPFPVESLLSRDVEWNLKGNYFLARNTTEMSWESLTHIIHPVNTVMPMLPEPSNLPTIIVFMPFLAVGGAERLALQLLRHLQNQARFIVVTVEGMDAALGTTADVFHQSLPFVYTAADFLLPHLNFSFLSYLIERFKADTLYIANGSNWIYDALSTLHQMYPGLRIVDQVYDHQFGWINRYDPTVVASIDAFISANPNITQAYAGRGARPDRIHFVEHAINMEDVNPADYSAERCLQIKLKLGLPAGKKLVTFCARLHPQKRPLDFVELVRRFAGEENLHFLMVGDGPLASAIDEQIMRIGLKNLTRCNFYSPISDIYAITNVMILPSEYEAMPLVILEALAMGKPVVATDVGHIRDVVEMTHGGVVVPNIGDVAALRMGVLKALDTPIDPAAMRQIIDQRFGISHISRQYLKVWLGESHA